MEESRRINPAAIRRFLEYHAWWKFVVAGEEDLAEALRLAERFALPRERILLQPEALRRDELIERVAVGDRGLQAPWLPLLPEAARHDLGRAARGVMAPRAVVLLSGGLDSTTALAVARAEGYECHALSFEYGQRHARELESARRVAAALGATAHLTLRLDLRAIGGSALTADIPVPKARAAEAIGTGIPVTYVPARNTIFLSHALAWAEVNGAQDIFIGVNVLDASGYPDCRPEYIAAFEHLANLATRAGVEGRSRFRIHTPLIALSKADIIRRGRDLGVDFSLTWSCYAPEADGRACGLCDACLLRQKGFPKPTSPTPQAADKGPSASLAPSAAGST